MEKTGWMEMYDVWAKNGKESLRYDLESIDTIIGKLEMLADCSEEIDLLLSKRNYILSLIGNYSEVKFYLNGDETGELFTCTFETEKSHKEWITDMEGAIEVFSITTF